MCCTERVLQVSQYLTKLWQKITGLLFWTTLYKLYVYFNTKKNQQERVSEQEKKATDR